MKKISRIYLGLIFLLLYLPIFYLIAYAFNAGGDMNAFTGFTLEHFQSLFEDTRLMLRRSLKDHFCPSIISLWWHLTL